MSSVTGMQTHQECQDGLGTSNFTTDSDDNTCSLVLEVLKCPLCSRQLVPMELDIIAVEDQKFQRIWWTCSGLRTQSCEFPTSLPENVFWTQRSMKDMKNGFFPLPNLHLLPPEYRHLYPKLFDVDNGSINKSFMHCMEGQLLGPVRSNVRPIRKCRRKFITERKKQQVSKEPVQIANEQDVAFTKKNVDDVTQEENVPHSVNQQEAANTASVSKEVENNKLEETCGHVSRNFISTSQKNGADNDGDNVTTINSVICARQKTVSADSPSSIIVVKNSSIADGSTGVMSRISRKHMDLLSKRKLSLAEKKAALEKQINKNDNQVSDSNKTQDTYVMDSFEEGKYLAKAIPAEEIIAEKESFTECTDCFNFLRKLKDGPLDEGITRRGLILRGATTPFQPEHFPSSIIDPLNWYRKVHLSGRTALDGFMAWYNLRYNRREYLDSLAAEMCKRGVMKYIPSIPIKQQRIVKQLREEVYGRKCVDIEALKKSFDSSALRLQMAHRLGIANVEPVVEKAKETNKTSQENAEKDVVQMWPLSSVPVITAPFYSAETEATDKSNQVFNEGRSSELQSTDFSDLPMPESSDSIISDYLSTGNCEIDEILHQKAVKQVQQVVNETYNIKRKGVEKELDGQEFGLNKDPVPFKQRRTSELSQGKNEDFQTNFGGFLDEYYDEDEEFCAQIYGS